jgi:hypothetical protein
MGVTFNDTACKELLPRRSHDAYSSVHLAATHVKSVDSEMGGGGRGGRRAARKFSHEHVYVRVRGGNADSVRGSWQCSEQLTSAPQG